MKLSVNISKIIPPHLPQILHRPRLLNLLEKNHEKRLVMILGQAAQGKSTLAASYAKGLKIPPAWMNLDKEDSDPTKLFYLIVYSLQYVLKDIDLDNLFSYSMGSIESRSEIPPFREWTQSIFEQITSPVHIVMDGLDRLSPVARAFEFLQALIENSPPNVRFIMLSREIPPLPFEFQNLKMRQEAFILENEDLAFIQEEIKAFFHEIRKISLSPDQLKKIYLATEGWIGGLILLSESLSKFPENGRERFISDQLPDYFEKEVFQYLGKEILSSQPKQVQEFLIKSSIIDLIEPGFIKELIQFGNAEEILREHVRKNLFVQSFYDEKKGWLFRYHHIFRDFLKAKSKERVGKEERDSLLLKAGILYEQRNDLENAVKYYLEAKAYPRAVSIIEQLGMELLNKARRSDLSRWISVLPNEIIEEHPWILLYQTMIQPYSLGTETVRSLEKVCERFKQRKETRGILASLARLIPVSVHSGVHSQPIIQLIKEAEASLQSSELEKYPRERGMLLYAIGTGYLLVEGDIRKGIVFCQNASLLFNQIKETSLQVNAQALSALGLVQIGEFSLAEETLKNIEKSLEKVVHTESRLPQILVNCLLSIYQGQFTKAKELVEKLQNEIEKHGLVNIYPWTYEISGYLEVAKGEFSEAEKIGKQYLNEAISSRNGMLKGLAFRLLGLIYLHKNDFEKAREALDQSMDVFLNESPSTYHLNRVRIKMGLVCTHLKDYKRAENALSEALQYFSSISGYLSVAEVHFATAFLQHDQGKKEDAALHLLNGFRVAEERKYEYFYTLGTKYLLKACLLALELKVDGAVDYAAHLLLTRLSPMAEKELEPLSNHPDPKIREKIWEIRRAVHRTQIPRLHIETLGGFRVIRGDCVIGEDEWDRSQPKHLLKAIVSYGAKSIPKEALMDQLWPEERPKAAERDFKTALQRLRKSLEPTLHKDFGSSYIHLHDKVVSIDSDLCDVDVDLFLSFLRRGKEMEKAGNVRDALSIYNEAIEMYKGDFLADELYLPWSDKKRGELKEKYIELLTRTANLNDRQGALKKAIECYKKAIRADSLLEDSYQKLMTLYSSKGMYNEALRTYEACKKVLKAELKTKPDPMTTALYNKIFEKIQSS